MSDKRQDTRMRRLKEARLYLPDGKTVITCKVRDISTTGAKLKCGEPFLIPTHFKVTITGEMELRPAEKMWAKGDEIGIKFK
jgi:hypothetical protein